MGGWVEHKVSHRGLLVFTCKNDGGSVLSNQRGAHFSAPQRRCQISLGCDVSE